MKAGAATAPAKSFGFDGRAAAFARHLSEQRRSAALIGAAVKEAEEHTLHVEALNRPILGDAIATNYRSDLPDIVRALEHRCDEAGARITALEQQILRLMEEVHTSISPQAKAASVYQKDHRL